MNAQMLEGKITIGNVCFVRDAQNKKILLLQRNKEPMKGMYTGVGGKTQFHEDIQASCRREVKEETGLDITDLKLRGILKTILEGKNSSWILFMYTATALGTDYHECPEGMLHWIDSATLHSHNLIGFIKEIIHFVLDDENFLEGTIWHDSQGNVLNKTISTSIKHNILP